VSKRWLKYGDQVGWWIEWTKMDFSTPSMVLMCINIFAQIDVNPPPVIMIEYYQRYHQIHPRKYYEP